jgi:HlyD family secretion protein
MIRQNYDNLVVRAPVDGQVTSLNAEVGESKSRGERLGQIDVVDRFSVRADVDEYYVTRVSDGQTAAFTYQDRSFLLVVDKVYPEVRNGRFQVDLVFSDAQPEGIRRGQTIHVRLELGGATDAVLLPRGGFYQDTGGRWVFLVDSGGKSAQKWPIRLGLKNPEYFEVLSGLQPGDRVITSSYRIYGDAERLVLR